MTERDDRVEDFNDALFSMVDTDCAAIAAVTGQGGAAAPSRGTASTYRGKVFSATTVAETGSGGAASSKASEGA